MLKRPQRLIILGASVLILLGAVAATWLALPPRQTGEVPVPAADATPEQVVTAFLNALNAHDCDTAETLVTARAKESARSWCNDVASLSDATVAEAIAEIPEHSGHSGSEEVARVPVTFDLDWRRFHSDGSLPEGTTTWGYLLVRDSPTAPWRIFDQGRG